MKRLAISSLVPSSTEYAAITRSCRSNDSAFLHRAQNVLTAVTTVLFNLLQLVPFIHAFISAAADRNSTFFRGIPDSLLTQVTHSTSSLPLNSECYRNKLGDEVRISEVFSIFCHVTKPKQPHCIVASSIEKAFDFDCSHSGLFVSHCVSSNDRGSRGGGQPVFETRRNSGSFNSHILQGESLA